jgi:DHA3 family macrolide efflux protein-like MFS transporter
VEAHAPYLSSWHLLRERNFGYLWLGQVVSGFGDRITFIALAVLVWQLTHSSIHTAVAVIVATVPHAVFGFFAGPVADTLGPRRTMVLCDLIRAVAIALIPGLLAIGAPLAAVYALVLVSTICSALFNPARLALTPSLLAQRELGGANSLILVSDRTVEIVGSAAAGFLVAFLGTAAFYVDAATFVFSALMLQRITLPANERRGRLSLMLIVQDAGTGLHVIRSDAVLMANLLMSLVGQMSIAIVATLTPVFLFRDLRAPLESFGLSEAAIAAGLVAAGLAMPWLLARLPKGRLVIAGFAGFGLVLIALGLSTSVYVAVVIFAIGGALNALFLVGNITIYQERTPADVRGRVFSTRGALLNMTWLPVMVGAGYLGDLVPAGFIIAAAGVLTLATAVTSLFVPAVRDVP